MDVSTKRTGAGFRLRLVALSLVGAILAVLVVLGSRSSVLPGTASGANPGPVVVVVHTLEILVLALEILAVILLVGLFRPPRRRKRDEEPQLYYEPPQVHWAVKLLVVAIPLLLTAGLIFAIYTFWRRYSPLQETGAPILIVPGLFGDGPDRAEPVAPSLELGWVDLAAAVLLAAVVLVLAARAFREERRPPLGETEPRRRARVLNTAVDESLRDVLGEDDPRRAVIAAYATMERILAAHGLPRRDIEAPLEYMARVFGELDVGGERFRTLTDLFELARFSHHVISSAMKELAISALVAIREEVRTAT